MPLNRRFHPRSERGLASAAVLLFAVVATIILVANFRLNYAVNMSSDAFDVFHSQMVEKNGVAQMVKESILAVGELATTQSTNSLQGEIGNRLSTLTFPDGGSLTLDATNSATALPANPSYPFGTPAPASQPDYFSASAHTRAIAGMGSLFTSLARQGPAADLGRLSFVFHRSSGAQANNSRTYTVYADLFSVPVTNIDVVAYGLPASGTVPGSAPTLPIGFLGSGATELVTTSNNPSNDPTAYPDLFNPSGAEQLPYAFRNTASLCWNAYEYLWSFAYQDALISAAQTAGSVYDFTAATEPTIDGVSAAGNAITIDCSQVTSPVITVVDSEGIGSVTIQGSGTWGIPFVLVIRNTAGSLGQTPVTFTGNNSRPVVFYLENASVRFDSNPQLTGALFLDPNTTVTGSFAWYGHVSFYAPSNPFAAVAGTVYDSPAVKSAIADLVPRALLVSTNAPFSPSLTP